MTNLNVNDGCALIQLFFFQIWLSKVQIFWEGHKNLKQSHIFLCYLHSASKIWKIVSNFFGLLRMSELYIAAHQSYKFKFLMHFCFFWDLYHPLMYRRMTTTLVKSTIILWRYERLQCILYRYIVCTCTYIKKDIKL